MAATNEEDTETLALQEEMKETNRASEQFFF
jgi:hypothetical protein